MATENTTMMGVPSNAESAARDRRGAAGVRPTMEPFWALAGRAPPIYPPGRFRVWADYVRVHL